MAHSLLVVHGIVFALKHVPPWQMNPEQQSLLLAHSHPWPLQQSYQLHWKTSPPLAPQQSLFSVHWIWGFWLAMQQSEPVVQFSPLQPHSPLAHWLPELQDSVGPSGSPSWQRPVMQ